MVDDQHSVHEQVPFVVFFVVEQMLGAVVGGIDLYQLLGYLAGKYLKAAF